MWRVWFSENPKDSTHVVAADDYSARLTARFMVWASTGQWLDPVRCENVGQAAVMVAAPCPANMQCGKSVVGAS